MKASKDNKFVIIRMLSLSLQSSLLVCDKINRAREIYKVCNSYPEPVLTAAFESLKRRGIVTYVKMVNTASFYQRNGRIVGSCCVGKIVYLHTASMRTMLGML